MFDFGSISKLDLNVNLDYGVILDMRVDLG